ncbi:2-hydroxyacid dehydrogenase [Roseomonas haemaphysalidis]|uniref:2-hydroxyacid dehydrogenase n=1 Tax=Roseomonas haemaphysalidis TaxID=2768162 RepID=UPI001F34A52A|nr:glyoxylate/hydroxypyruvate reductase A [Roseomonas haemaphysalidis]
MLLLVKSGGPKAVPDWQSCFRRHDPRLDVRCWTDPGVDPAAVRYVVVWEPEEGRLSAMTGLRAVFSSAAGVDHITRVADWPRHLPLVRMGGDDTAQRMGEYISWSCLSLLRDARTFALAQPEGRWAHRETRFSAPQRTVGILGLGNLGAAAARMLQGLGFPVRGWSRSRKALPGVESFAGAEELPAFLAGTDILVCLLPSTPETAGLIGAELLVQLPAGAGLVSAGRGQHVVEPDLVAALDSGHLSGAVMDVFATEPLPPDSPLWRHPRITVTPHIASMASRQERARYVAEAIAAQEAGRPLPNLFDPAKGY